MEDELSLESVLNKDSNYWIGLSDFAHEGTWRWQESHKEPTYTNWVSGQPNIYHGDEDCVEKAYNMDGSGKWNDHQCNLQDRAHALCQIVK